MMSRCSVEPINNFHSLHEDESFSGTEYVWAVAKQFGVEHHEIRVYSLARKVQTGS